VAVVVDKLKQEAIKEFSKMLDKMEKGYKCDYKKILDIINLIDLQNKLPDSIFIAHSLLK